MFDDDDDDKNNHRYNCFKRKEEKWKVSKYTNLRVINK